MEKLTTMDFTGIKEIPLTIYDGDTSYHGGDQHWFPKALHQLSGCGPVAAANITAYLSQTFPQKYHALYPYEGILMKRDFVKHMIDIRKHVKPGVFGLTCVHQFSENVLAFAQEKGINLIPHIFDDHTDNIEKALTFIANGLSKKLPVAILVLKHPAKELEEYAWHWMLITGIEHNPIENKVYICVSTYGEHHRIDFHLLWNGRGPQNIINFAYFE